MKVAQLCATLCGPMDYSLPVFPFNGILPARTLEWVAISFSRGSSSPRDQTLVSCIADPFFTSWATREPSINNWPYQNIFFNVLRVCLNCCSNGYLVEDFKKRKINLRSNINKTTLTFPGEIYIMLWRMKTQFWPPGKMQERIVNMLLSPSSLCSPQQAPIQEMKGWGKEETIIGKPADGEDGRLAPQNNHLTGSGCQVLL